MSTQTPESWRTEIIQFVRSFASLSIRPGEEGIPEQIHLRRGIGDLMHVLGYFFEQNGQRLHDVPVAQRLTIAADTLRYIAEHLDD